MADFPSNWTRSTENICKKCPDLFHLVAIWPNLTFLFCCTIPGISGTTVSHGRSQLVIYEYLKISLRQQFSISDLHFLKTGAAVWEKWNLWGRYPWTDSSPHRTHNKWKVCQLKVSSHDCNCWRILSISLHPPHAFFICFSPFTRGTRSSSSSTNIRDSLFDLRKKTIIISLRKNNSCF